MVSVFALQSKEWGFNLQAVQAELLYLEEHFILPDSVCLFILRFNVPFNKLTNTLVRLYALIMDTTWRPELGTNPGPLSLESNAPTPGHSAPLQNPTDWSEFLHSKMRDTSNTDEA